MNEAEKDLDIKSLKKEISKLRLEANMRKSLSNQLSLQKKVADESKAEALAKSEQLELISSQLSKYLSPQIHEQIFSGKQSVGLKSYRKKLTVFFSDIVGFTNMSDELESEELTSLLNFYLNEMSKIALKFGGTIDKYMGDGIMIFFGDPESLGPEQDATKCLEMALEMQSRMNNLTDYWGKTFGLKEDLKIRIGINTGICTVGNFGSEDRLDYTAMGATVNLASRLEMLSKPGSINVSEETKLLVETYFKFGEPKEAQVKGFLRKIKFFELEQNKKEMEGIFKLEGTGYKLKVDKDSVTEDELKTLQVRLAELSRIKFTKS